MGTPPYNFVIAGIAGVLFYIIFHKTKFGHGIRALGCNDYVAVSYTHLRSDRGCHRNGRNNVWGEQ